MPASESDDSDAEGGLGNMSHVIIRPPGESGKAKRGNLCFDASFETGNLGRVNLIGNFEYDLCLRPDTCNPRFRFWFNFTVRNCKKDQCVIFHVVNFSKEYNLFNSHLTPLVKSTSRPKWQRLPRKNVFYYRSRPHRQRYILSFAFNFDKEEDTYQFAVAPPYSYSMLQCYLDVLETSQTEQRFVRSVLCKTVQNRNLDLITIDHVTGVKETKRIERNIVRVIIIICRSHPGDSPTSFVCQGFLEYLIGNHRIGEILRRNFVFKIIPMLNPDGVFLGNNRCNLLGQDMNRVWHASTEYSHPTIHAVKNMFHELDNSSLYQIDFIFDLHAHSSLHGCFIYGNTYDDIYRYERHLVFPRLFSVNAEGYAAQNMMFNRAECKIGTARRYCCEHLSNTVDSYSLHVSMGEYYLRDRKTLTLYNESGYFRCGRNLAYTFFKYYQFIHVLPLSILSELYPPRRKALRTSRRPPVCLKKRQEVKTRPNQTRLSAPISYKNIFITNDFNHASNDKDIFLYKRNYHTSLKLHNLDNLCDTNRILKFHTIVDRTGKLEKNINYNSNSGITQSSRDLKSENAQEKLFSEDYFTYKLKPTLSIINLNQLTRCPIKP